MYLVRENPQWALPNGILGGRTGPGNRRRTEMEFQHKPVLFDEAIASLAIQPDGIYIDGTAGGGGHSKAIASR